MLPVITMLLRRILNTIKTFIWDFSQYWSDSIAHLLQICSATSERCSIDLRSGEAIEYSELIVMFTKPVWDVLRFVAHVSCWKQYFLKMGTLWL